MKKVLSVIAIGAIIASAGPAMAWTSQDTTSSWSANQQTQAQELVGADFGANGMASLTTQEQKGFGGSASDWGSSAWEGQAQGELTKVTFTNGYATHSYNQGVVTYGGSTTDNWGVAGHSEHQTLDSGILTVGDGNGQASLSGMATVGGADAHSTAYGWDATANAGTFAQYNNAYEYKNIGATSGIVQTGFQAGMYETSTSVDDGQYWWNWGGTADAVVTAQQVGGTAAYNDGNGTYMAGAGAAEGSVKVTASAYDGSWYYNGNAEATASAEQVQQHSYVQAADNGAGQSQWAVGTVGTYNSASVYATD